jgi:hypothetical protein
VCDVGVERGGDVIEQAPADMVDPVDPVGVMVALSVRALGATAGVAGGVRRRTRRAVHPVVGPVLRPRWAPDRLQPGRWLDAVGREGEARLAALRAELSKRLDALVPLVLDEVLRRADLTDVVLRYLDLDRAVSAVDLDAAAARLDVSAVIDRVDLTSVVLEQVDLDALITAVLDRVDLTAVVLRRVDLDALITAVLDHVDLIPLAEEVIEGVNLPEIIRESTGTMASDTVQGVRMQGIVADEAVGRVVDRLLLRRAHRSTRAPTTPGELSSSRAGTSSPE